MKNEMTFKERMLLKYPNIDKPTNCSVCHACLQYLFRVHRIGMKWYCDECYIKYKEKKKMNGLREIVEENKKADVKKIDKDEEISLLQGALKLLTITFDEYAHAIYDKHGELFDEYDLTDLKILIEQKQKVKA